MINVSLVSKNNIAVNGNSTRLNIQKVAQGLNVALILPDWVRKLVREIIVSLVSQPL